MLCNLILRSFAAAFAVFGFACAVRMIADRWFVPRQLLVAVEIRTAEDADLPEMLLHEARSAFFGNKSVRLAVLLSESLCENGEIPASVREAIDRYGADCYLVE